MPKKEFFFTYVHLRWKFMLLMWYVVLLCLSNLTMAQVAKDNLQLQRAKKLDSLSYQLKQDSARIFRFQKLRAYVSVDNRYTLIQNAFTTLHGFHAGVRLSDRHVLSIGYYTLSQQMKNQFVNRNTGETDQRLQQLRLRYVTLFYQYTLIDHRFFRISLPVELGYGQSDVQWTSAPNGNKPHDKRHDLFPVGSGIQVILKPCRWIGLSSAIGYRYVLDADPNLDLNGWYYSYGVWLDVRQVIRDVRFYLIKKPAYKKEVHKIQHLY